MKNQLFEKLKESLVSILPVTLIVVILNFTPLINLTTYEVIMFCISAILLIIGISLFNLGADLAMQPMGEQIGSSLIKIKNMAIILLICFVLGFLITVAEPDLSVLASQVKDVIPSLTLIITIGIGVGLFLVVAIIKTLLKKDLTSIIIYLYMILFALTALVVINGNEAILPLAFDSGGVTTGPITVPFIMALGIGLSQTVGGKSVKENSFGLVALCSVGPIIALLILALGINKDLTYTIPNYSISQNIVYDFFMNSLSVAKEVSIALGLIVVFFFLIEIIFLKIPKKKLLQIGIGIIYTFFGLVIFFFFFNIGFLLIGFKMGQQLATNHKTFSIILAFIIGLVVVLAEPAIHVLNKQVEEITNGGVSKKSMLIALSLGVGIALCLSIIRIIYDFSIMYYLIPGYFLSLGLSFFVPKIYTAIAFDSGGVASGPLTSSFILPFAIGICLQIQGEEKVLSNAFGVVAMVAMAPLITIQLLGFTSELRKTFKSKYRTNKMLNADDEQIINF